MPELPIIPSTKLLTGFLSLVCVVACQQQRPTVPEKEFSIKSNITSPSINRRVLSIEEDANASDTQATQWLSDFADAYAMQGGVMPTEDEFQGIYDQFTAENPAWTVAAQAAVAELSASNSVPSPAKLVAAMNRAMQEDPTLLGTPFADRPEVEQAVQAAIDEMNAFDEAHPTPKEGESTVQAEFEQLQGQPCGRGRSPRGKIPRQWGLIKPRKTEQRLLGFFRSNSDRSARSLFNQSGRPVPPSTPFAMNNGYPYQYSVPYPSSRTIGTGRNTRIVYKLNRRGPDRLEGNVQADFYDDSFINDYRATFNPSIGYTYSCLWQNRVPYVRQTTGTECSIATWTFAYHSLLNATTPRTDSVMNSQAANTYAYYKRTYWRKNGWLDDMIRSLGATPSQLSGWIYSDSRPGRSTPMFSQAKYTNNASITALMTALHNKQRPMIAMDNGSGWLDGAHWVTLVGYDNKFIVTNESERTQRSRVSHMSRRDFAKAWTGANVANRSIVFACLFWPVPGLQPLSLLLFALANDIRSPMIVPVNYSVNN